MDGLRIRLATEEDLPRINEIYNYFVANSTCTYQLEPESMDNRRTWFRGHDDQHPITVGEWNGQVVGWASLSQFRTRAAYRHTVEDSVYIAHDEHGRGIGKALLTDLIVRARTLGHHTIIAGISAEQTASLRLHEKLGFEKAAHLREVGFKFDHWLDVVYLQLMLDK